MKKLTMIVAVSFVLLGFASLASATHDLFDAGDEREATYIGAQTAEHTLNQDCADTLGEPECPARIIRGRMSMVCDYSGQGTFTSGGMYKGEGGAGFCQIQKSVDNESVTHDQFIRVKYEDISVFDPIGSVTCPETVTDDSGDIVTWHNDIGYLEGNDAWLTIQVPTWCDGGQGGHEHRTNILIFNLAVDLRDGVAVGGAVEGTAYLEVLSPLPGV